MRPAVPGVCLVRSPGAQQVMSGSYGGAQVVPEVVARVHVLLPPAWDWAGVGGRPGAPEEDRELAELQRCYYAFLNALAQNGLLQALQARRDVPCSAPPAAAAALVPVWNLTIPPTEQGLAVHTGFGHSS